MSYQNEEEGLPLVDKVNSEAPQRILSRAFIVVLGVTFLALTFIAAYTVGARSSIVSSTELYASHSIVTNSFEEYSFLKGKFMTAKFKTIGHGLTETGELIRTQKAYFSLNIVFFGTVSKVHYDKSSGLVDSSELMGSMKGLDDKGNIDFVGGHYCKAKGIDFYGNLEVICGDKPAITGVYMIDPCNMKVTVSHPEQCHSALLKESEAKNKHSVAGLVNLVA